VLIRLFTILFLKPFLGEFYRLFSLLTYLLRLFIGFPFVAYYIIEILGLYLLVEIY
jgi:hypothetical protein